MYVYINMCVENVFWCASRQGVHAVNVHRYLIYIHVYGKSAQRGRDICGICTWVPHTYVYMNMCRENVLSMVRCVAGCTRGICA